MKRRSWRLAAPLAAVALSGVAAAAYGATDSGSATAASANPFAARGPVTLTVWDQEVRGGQAPVIQQLNKEFQKRYPNVTIKRTAKSFTDLNTTLKLAVTGPNPPDVVQANQGWQVMGPLVRAKILMPLDKYAAKYKWKKRWPTGLLKVNSFSADGKQFGGGQLFGLSQAGEVVGVFYNKAKLKKLGGMPKTFAAFEALLGKAKSAGEVPIMFGNLDKWPGIHYFEAIAARTTTKGYLRNLIFGSGGVSFNTPAMTKAATTFQQWGEKGYFVSGFNGLGYDDAWKQFGTGKGVFLIAGTWVNSDLQKAMGKNLGFFLLPGKTANAPKVALGGVALPFAIVSKSKNPDIAAAYIDFLTNNHAMQVVSKIGSLPALVPSSPRPPAGTSLADIFNSWKSLNDDDGVVPYMDYATPTFYDTLTAAIQKVGAGKDSPSQFLDELQKDYGKFIKS
jgi:raffinose/stachyose/melibiose transport system substrate-binding protein